MRLNSDYIHWLMVERLTGEISEAEERYLTKLLDTEPAVREAYKALQEQFSKEDLENKFARLKSPENWRPMPTFENSQSRSLRGRIVAMTAAAAILAAVLFSIYLINKKQSPLPDEVAIVNPRQHSGIKLHVSGGETVDLSNNTGQVTVGNGTLLNGNSDSLSLVVGSHKNTSSAVNTLTVPNGMDYKVILSDGTMVWMNSSSILKFPFNFLDKEREITIEGEAYLEVAKDKNKPFIVHTEHGSVKVLGTQFNVNTYDPHTLRVSLVEGSVQVEADQKPVTLKPGQEVVYIAEQKNLKVQGFDEDEVLSWRQGIKHFYNNTVREICEVFPRWYGVDIVIDNKSIYDKTFTGVLNRNEPIDKFLRALKATSSISTYEFKDGKLHLK